MALPASVPTLESTRQLVDSTSQGLKNNAQASLAAMQAGTIDANAMFRLLDQWKGYNDTINAVASALGSVNYAALNAYVQAQKHDPVTGVAYAGTYTTDAQTTMSAVTACITWVVANWPKDSTGTFILSHVLNADGTRSPRSFTSADTAVLQTLLSALIATIG